MFSDEFSFSFICYQTDAPEDHNAVHIERPFAFFTIAGIEYAVADLVVSCDRVDLMTNLCAVKVQLVFLRIIPVVHRNAVGVAVVSDHGQDAALFFFQHPHALLFTDLLPESPHGSEGTGYTHCMFCSYVKQHRLHFFHAVLLLELLCIALVCLAAFLLLPGMFKPIIDFPGKVSRIIVMEQIVFLKRKEAGSAAG